MERMVARRMVMALLPSAAASAVLMAVLVSAVSRVRRLRRRRVLVVVGRERGLRVVLLAVPVVEARTGLAADAAANSLVAISATVVQLNVGHRSVVARRLPAAAGDDAGRRADDGRVDGALRRRGRPHGHVAQPLVDGQRVVVVAVAGAALIPAVEQVDRVLAAAARRLGGAPRRRVRQVGSRPLVKGRRREERARCRRGPSHGRSRQVLGGSGALN